MNKVAYVKYRSKCPKSYTGLHIWTDGSIHKNLRIFGITFAGILCEKIVDLEVCRACGMMRKK